MKYMADLLHEQKPPALVMHGLGDEWDLNGFNQTKIEIQNSPKTTPQTI